MILVIFLSSCREGGQLLADPCEDVLCGPGTCIDGDCDCPEGFAGENCEQDLADVELKLKSIKEDGVRKFEYEYTFEGNLLKRTFYNDLGEFQFRSDYSYDQALNILTVENTNSSNNISSLNYYQLDENGKLTREFYNASQVLVLSYVYSFFPDCGISLSQATNASGGVSSIVNDLTGNNCDRSESLFDDTGALTRYREFETDGKNNPILSPIHYFVDFNLSNTVKFVAADLTAASTGEIPDEDISYDAVFTYNVNSYPITETRTFYDGRIENYSFEYY